MPKVPTTEGGVQAPGPRARIAADEHESPEEIGLWLLQAHLPEDQQEVDPVLVDALMTAEDAHQVAHVLLKAGANLTEDGWFFAMIGAATTQETIDAGVFHRDEIKMLRKKIAKWNRWGPVVGVAVDPHRGFRALMHAFEAADPGVRRAAGSLGLPAFSATSALHLHLGRLAEIADVEKLKAAIWMSLRHVLGETEQWKMFHRGAGARFWPDRLIEDLAERDFVLFLHGLDQLPRDIIKSINMRIGSPDRQAGPSGQPARIVMVRWTKPEPSDRSELATSLGGEDAWDYCKSVLKIYRNRLGIKTPVEGTALARTRAFYLRRVGRQVCPSTVRFRAACLADPTRIDAYDPTQGAKRLLNPRLLARSPEIGMLIEDIAAHVSEKLSPIELGRARLEATCLHYSTPETRKKVWAAMKIDEYLNDEITTGLHYVNEVNATRSTKEGVGRFFGMPNSVRAVVQDHWIANDPVSRSAAHRALGAWMEYEAERDPAAFVQREYPFDAPWGQPIAICYAEALRHYVRASETATDRGPDLEKADRLLKSKLGEIQALDLGRIPDQPFRSLSMATGQYYLKLELLFLLSRRGSEVDAHFEPDPLIYRTDKDRGEWFREVGFALAMSLRLTEAVLMFVRGYESYANVVGREAAWARLYLLQSIMRFAVEARPANPFGLAMSKFRDGLEQDLYQHRISLLRAERDIIAKGGTDTEVADARRESFIFFAWTKTMRVTSQGKAPPQWVKTFARDVANWAIKRGRPPRHMLYVIDILSWSSEGAAAPAESEADCLLAWRLCERCLFAASERRLDHEHLCLLLRKASILTRLRFFEVAETIMETILVRVKLHGASPHLLCEFRIACVRVLIDLGATVYGMAAYGMPAQDALEGRSECLFARRIADLDEEIRHKADPKEPVEPEKRAEILLSVGNDHAASPDPLDAVVILDDPAIISQRMHHIKARLGHAIESE